MGTTQLENEVELVREMALGNGAALARFYAQHRGQVCAILLRVLRSGPEAEEIVQEVFLELWRRADQYDSDRGTVNAWVTQIAKCRAIDAVRARKRRAYERHQPVEEGGIDVVSEQAPVDSELDSRQSSRRVQRALCTLSPEQRQSVALSFFEELSHAEISQELGIPLGTVKSRILSGVRKLRSTLEAPTAEWRMLVPTEK